MANISNTVSSTLISGTSNADSIINSVSSGTVNIDVTINAGDGDDTIQNYAPYALINGEAGNDSVYNYNANYVTVNVGDGNDSIRIANSSNCSFIGGNGNDFIDSDEYSIYRYASTSYDNTIMGGSGKDTIYVNYGDSIRRMVIFGDEGNDSIFSIGHESTIYGGSGDDTIQNAGYITVYLDAGAGNDLIENHSYKINDTTIVGGTGNDTIRNAILYQDANAVKNVSYGRFIQYANGDGNDIVEGYNNDDTINITSGSINSSTTSGNDIILTVGSGTITLKEANGKTLNINFDGSSSGSGGSSGSGSAITGTTGADSLVGTAYGDTISGLNGKDTLKGGDGNDSIVGGKGKDLLYGDAGDDTLFGGQGDDTLTGGDGEDIFVYSNATGNDVITDYNAEDKIFIKSGSIKSISAVDSDVLLSFASGSIKVKNSFNKTITVVDASENTTSLIYGSTVSDNISGTSGVDILYGYKGADSIYGDSGADSIYGNAGADTLVGGKGKDTLSGGNGNDVFVYSTGDGNDVITDYAAEQDTIKILSGSITGSSETGSAVVLTIDTGTIKLNNTINKLISIVDENYNDHFLIQGSASSDNINGTENAETIYGGNGADNILGKAGSDTIYGDAGKDTIKGGAGDDYIEGNKGADRLYGNSGNDTLIGGAGADTLTGGNDSDCFVYTAGDGNDIITDYTSEDIIQLGSSETTITKDEISGSDYVLTVGENTITLKNAASQTINVKDFAGQTKQYNVQTAEASYREIFEDNNFIESDVDSIINTKAEISINNYELEILNKDLVIGSQNSTALISRSSSNRSELLNG